MNKLIKTLITHHNEKPLKFIIAMITGIKQDKEQK